MPAEPLFDPAPDPVARTRARAAFARGVQTAERRQHEALCARFGPDSPEAHQAAKRLEAATARFDRAAAAYHDALTAEPRAPAREAVS